MNRRELADAVTAGASIVRRFLAEEAGPSGEPSTYDDWNRRDVVGHIVGWMDYSSDKLTSLKLGTPPSQQYSGVASLDDINRTLYQRAAGKDKEEMESAYLAAWGSYLRALSLFSDDEVGRNSFDTGFAMDLWRYMVMDTVVHPVQHILYHHLKRGELGDLAEVVRAAAGPLGRYSPDGKAWGLDEFPVRSAAVQSHLETLGRRYGGEGPLGAFVAQNRAGA